MKNKYDMRLRVFDEIAEPVPSGTRITIYRKRNKWRVPLLWASIIGAMFASYAIAVNGAWLVAIIPMVYVLFILSMNLIGIVREK